MKQQKIKWVKIGEVGVDSGQLMVCDPCYLSGWRQDDGEYMDVRRYKDRSGRIFAYNSGACQKLGLQVDEYFQTYESKLSTRKTPNQHNADGEWEEIPYIAQDQEFGYNGVSHGTINNLTHQINYEMGHAGRAVAFRSGFGDGCYDIMAKIYMGRVLEVKIVMVTKEECDEMTRLLGESHETLVN